MNKIIYKIGFFILLISCSQSSLKTERIVDRYGNGNIKTKKFFELKSDTTNFILVEYYENGKIKRTGPMKDSIVYGQWEYFYDNGNIKQKGNYVIDDSLNNGNWTYSYKKDRKDKNGNILKERDTWICSVDWMAREKKNLHVCKDGYWEFYYENGRLKTKGNYENGWSNGIWVEFSTNGQLILKANFKNKRPIGEWKYWYSNSQLMKIVQYKDSVELLLQAFDKDGTQRIADGKGQFKETYTNGTFESFLATYDKGIYNGQYIRYFENGKIEEEGHYVDGKKDGAWTLYLFYFGKWMERNYKNGKLDGYTYKFTI